MKKHLLTLLLIIGALGLYAQTTCVSYGDPFWSQPKELNRGRLKFSVMQYGNPYTLIDRFKNNDPNRSFIDIRNELSKNTRLQAMYQQIYTFAIESMPASGGNWASKESKLAVWAKINAFIFVIGLDPQNGFIPLDSTDSTGAARNAFAYRAMQAFDHMDYRCPVAPFKGFSDPVELLKFRSRDLIYYCEAYDWLKGANADPSLDGRCPLEPYDQDKNDGTCSPRYRLRLFARNFYRAANGIAGPIESPTGWKRNHGIMSAAAIGMAAIVLNDAGVETNLIKSLFDWIRPTPNYSPVKWYNLGVKYRENLLVGNLALRLYDVPQTNGDGSAGYAEGPSYFNYAFSCLIPFLRAEDNIKGQNSEGTIKPFYERNPFKGMFKWIETINSGEQSPTYDNSHPVVSLLGLTGNEGFRYGNSFVPEAWEVALYPDYIAVMARPSTQQLPEEVVTLPNSGNTLLRTRDINKSNHHYFHMLHETGIAVDHDDAIGGTHEDDDWASFSIFVNGNTQLALDPPYFGWSEVEKTRAFDKHNTLDLLITPPAILRSREFSNPVVKTNKNGFSLTYNNEIKTSTDTTYIYTLQREVTGFHLAGGRTYYLLNDYAPTGKGIVFRLSGNGDVSNSTFTYHGATRMSEWSNPCSTTGYRLLHFFAGIGMATNPIIHSYESNDSYGVVPGNKHTKIILKHAKQQTIIQSLIIPYGCSDPLPVVRYDEQEDYVATIIESVDTARATLPISLGKNSPPPPTSLVTDTVRTIHIAQLYNDSLLIADPYKISNIADTAKTNAQHATLSIGTYANAAPGACSNSAVHFKEAMIAKGSYLSFKDTSYISAPIEINANYRLISKFRYQAYVDLNGVSGLGYQVTLLLPDHELGYAMAPKKGAQTLPYSYNDTTGVLSITITEPTTFTIELADPCLADCFFPPTNEPIDTLADFNTGTTEVLGHDLDIIQEGGELHISKGSKMSICSDFMFRNRDSLILYAEDTDSSYVYRNPMDGPSTISTPVRNRIGSGRSMIIVNDKAALVLDSGSFTHVGDNATILVLKGGTLLVRKHATLEIGGNESNNRRMFGEVIAEEGAFVCIEDSSSIYFYADTPTVDTQDVNIFYVNLNSYTPTIAGTNPLGARGRFTTPLGSEGTGSLPFAGEYAGSACLPFCDIKLYRLPHGINNRDFGWCNFSEPVAWLNLPPYACYGAPVVLKDNRVLNETGYTLEVYNDTGLIMSQVSTPDSPRFAGLVLPALEAEDHYDIRLYVQNDCGEQDTFTAIINIPSLPVAGFTIDSVGCQGSGHILADGSASVSGSNLIPHTWYVQRLDTLLVDTIKLIDADDYTMEWVNDTATVVDSAFNFPGFVWKGGYSYVVGLIVKGICSDSTATDTIYFPLSAKISLNARPGVFNNPIGPSALQLNGAVTGASGWSWSPTTFLSDSTILDPYATPDGPVTYVLTAISGSCVATDTVKVLYQNDLAYAGRSRTICASDSVAMGTGYTLAALLGTLYASHQSEPYYSLLFAIAATDPQGLSRMMTEHYAESPVLLCTQIVDLIVSERFLDQVVEHPAFATFYQGFLNDPTDVANYTAFSSRIAPDNELYDLAMSSGSKFDCISDYLQGLYNQYQTCGIYRLYPDLSKEAALVFGALYVSSTTPSIFLDRWDLATTEVNVFPGFMAGFIANGGLSELSCDFSTLFAHGDLDDVYYTNAGFQAYYDSLLYGEGTTADKMQLFADFISAGGPAQDYINLLTLNDECFNELIERYTEWLSGYTCLSKKHIVWERRPEGGTWQYLNQWDGKYTMYDLPDQPTEYRITVVDLFTNMVEYDIAEVVADTPLAVIFDRANQMDSTVFFVNYTSSLAPSELSFLWIFGDGDSSTATHPVHTFPAFDSAYVVCLYATNTCGTYMYCDTIGVDSNALLFFGYGKRGNEPANPSWQETPVKQQPVKLSNQNMLGDNRPNPFSGTTEIEYELVPSYKTAELLVTNILGQKVYSLSLPTVKGVVRMDGSTLQDGLYYYSLIVDGEKADTKIMVVR